jgi:hypothetical protein
VTTTGRIEEKWPGGAGAWLPITIHPQNGMICDTAWRPPLFWPEDGFLRPLSSSSGPVPWPVPRIKGARLVECSACGRTGVQPRTYEDAVRYIPGSSISPEGHMTVVMAMDQMLTYPTGSGEDEEEDRRPLCQYESPAGRRCPFRQDGHEHA